MRTRAVALAVITCAAIVDPAWAAPPDNTKRACAQASEQAQLDKLHGHLISARAQLLSCAREVCPKVVRNDCAQALADVDRAMPTIVPAASANGRDLVDVRVRIDDADATSHLDGTAIPVDPGKHTLHFEADGMQAVDQEIVAREGDKSRVVAAHMTAIGAPPAATNAPPVQAESAPPPSQEPPRASSPVLAYVIGGLGIVALGVAGYFEIDSLGRYGTLHDGCAQTHSCLQSDVDTVYRERLFAGIGLGVGVVGVGVAAVLLLTRGSAPQQSTTGFRITAGPLDGGGYGALAGRF